MDHVGTLRRAGRSLGALDDLIGSIGPPVYTCRQTAAALFGIDGYALRPPFHLLVDRGRNITRIQHRIHTTTVLERIDRAMAGDIPATSPTRTIVDLARTESVARLTETVTSAILAGLTSEDFLFRRLIALRGSGRGGVRRLLGVVEGRALQAGRPSWLEREFLALVTTAGLPRPLTEQVLARRGDHLIRVDCQFSGTPVVVELLGYRFHRTAAQLQVDAERLNRLQLAGYIVLQFTYADVTENPRQTVSLLTDALSAFGIHVTT
ncbi:MAG: hypothetical protein V9E89_16450 [Ilumatobacteraceae bacterium]